MKNIWTGKSPRKKTAASVTLAVFLLTAAAAFFAINNSDKADEAYMTENVRRSIEKAAVLCYSAEGAYPENLQYLKDNYGILVNDDKYMVHYSYAGGNIPPDVIVTVRSE